MTIRPTGYLTEPDDGRRQLAYERTFRAPIADVWAAVTESPRLERWIGVWTGDAAPGASIWFTMTAEGAVEPEEVRILACEPPTHLAVDILAQAAWGRIDLTLTESDGVTTLVFAQAVAPGDNLADFGPGWEYYLDRLVASWLGEPFADWEAYPPAIDSHYAGLAAQL